MSSIGKDIISIIWYSIFLIKFILDKAFYVKN